MLDIHFLEDSDAIIGDDHISHGVHHHLVHALGAKSGPHCAGYSLRRHDVRSLRFSSRSPLAAFPKDEYRGPAELSCQFNTSIRIYYLGVV